MKTGICGFIAVGLLMLFTTCEHEGPKEDTTKPLVVISSPSPDHNYAEGEVVHVMATITDNVKLKNTRLHFHNESSDEQVIEKDYVPGETSCTINEEYVIPGPDFTEFEIEVTGFDEAGYSRTEIVHFTANN